MSIIVYGIKNCNTVKLALKWFQDKNITFQFHDYKIKGIQESKLKIRKIFIYNEVKTTSFKIK